MPLGLGGETIGTAFVRILADGTGLDQSVKNEIDDAIDKAHLESSGEKAGKDVTKGFEKELTRGPGVKNAMKGFRLAVANNAHMEKYFDSPSWKIWVDKVEKEFGDVGFLAAKEMEEKFTSRGSLAGLAEEQLNVISRINRLRAVEAKHVSDEMKAFEKQFDADMRSIERSIDSSIDNIGRDIEKFHTQVLKTRDSNRSALLSIGKDWNSFGVELEKIRKKQEEAGRGTDFIGKAFGKGSRNDFLNIIGSMAQGLANLTLKAFDFGKTLFNVGKEATEAFKVAREGFTGLEGLMKGTQGAAASIGESLAAIGPGALAGIAAAVPIIMAVASAISLTAGAVVALAGTIGTGLVGAIGLAAAALLPLAAGIGAVVAGYVALSDAQKKALGVDLKPLTSAFGDLADIAGKNIFGNLGDQLARMVPVLQQLKGLADGVSQSVSAQIGIWSELVASGGFRTFFDTLARDLPGQIAILGSIMRNLVLTITGLFNGMSPVLTRFLGDIERVVIRFREFTNSAKGQKGVTDFFNDALDAAEALGGALLKTAGFLGNLLRAGAKFGGNKVFEDFGNKMREWSDWLTDPANQDAIEQWVSDGAAFAEALGKIVVAVGHLVAALDTPFFRTVVTGIFESMAGSLELTAKAVKSLTDNSAMLISPLGAVTGLLGNLSGGSNKTATATGRVVGSLDGLKAAMKRTGTSTEEYAKKAAAAREKTAELRSAARTSASGFLNFNQALSKSKDSLSGFLKQLQDQVRDLNNWARNVRRAGELGVSEGLIKKFQEAGPAGASMLAKLVGEGKSKIPAFNATIDSGTKAVKRAQDALVNFGNTKIPPKKVEVDTKDAQKDVDNLHSSITAIPNKTVTVTINEVINEAFNSKRRGIDTMAAGGVFATPRRVLMGEAGPEAIVPLSRPLGQVDPSVRALSAFAQGLPTPGGAGPSRVFNNTFNITNAVANPEAVAGGVINRLIASAY